VDGAAPSADAGRFSLADPRGLDEADVARRLKQGQGNRVELPSSRSLPTILRAMGAAYVAVLAIAATRELFALDAPPWIVALAAVGATTLAVRAKRPLRCRSRKPRSTSDLAGWVRPPVPYSKLL
jgi:hypothetical protein